MSLSSLITLVREATDGVKQRRRIPSRRRQVVYQRDGKRCRLGIKCDRKKKLEYHEFHVDHIKPVYFHGNDYTFNLCVACKECNLSKGANPNIKPHRLPLWRKLYGLFLMCRYRDYPRLKDFT